MTEATVDSVSPVKHRGGGPEHMAKMQAARLAARAGRVTQAAPKPSVAAPAAPPPDALSAILAKLDGISARQTDLETRVNQGMPRFVKAKAPTKIKRAREFAELEITETKDGAVTRQVRRKIATAKGTPLSAGMLRHTGTPLFQIGQTVQINPNVQPDGSWMLKKVQIPRTNGRGFETVKEKVLDEDGNPVPRFWSDVLSEVQKINPDCTGEGEVRQLLFLSDKSGLFKYRVYFPGMSQSNQGDGYWEPELMAV